MATISADGSKLNYSTYFGGSQDDCALAVAVDSQGNVIFAGQTWSGDFPVPGGVAAALRLWRRLRGEAGHRAPPAIASVLNGASFQPGIEAGSWVTIQGTNLANTTRTWNAPISSATTCPPRSMA